MNRDRPLRFLMPMQTAAQRSEMVDLSGVHRLPRAIAQRLSSSRSVRMSRSPGMMQDDFELSDAEIHFLYWFIQGSIMVPETRWRLRYAWGMCDRHAWGGLAVETAYRPTFLHGPAVLYHDLMERARAAFEIVGPCKAFRLAWAPHRAMHDVRDGIWTRPTRLGFEGSH